MKLVFETESIADTWQSHTRWSCILRSGLTAIKSESNITRTPRPIELVCLFEPQKPTNSFTRGSSVSILMDVIWKLYNMDHLELKASPVLPLSAAYLIFLSHPDPWTVPKYRSNSVYTSSYKRHRTVQYEVSQSVSQ